MRLFIRAIRAPFFTATGTAVLVGGAIALKDGQFHWGYWLLTLLGVLCANAATNTANDYMDHISGDDTFDHLLTPFSGGSRVIQEGLYSPRQMLTLCFAFLTATVAIGLYLVWMRGPLVLVIGVLGVFVTVFYNLPPLKIAYRGRGLGELATGVAAGPLIVCGAYAVQADRVTLEAFLASLSVGLFVTAVLYINEFPDYEADKAAGKRTLTVVLGRQRAVPGYVFLVAGAYLVPMLAVILGIMPWPALLVLLTMPMAWRAWNGLRIHYDDPQRLVPSNAATVQIHLVACLLLTAGYILTTMVV